MTRAAGKPRAPESAWGAEILRATWFHQPGQAVQVEGAWKAVTGEDPDHSVAKPKSGERLEVGTFESGQLILHAQAQAGRVDWVLSADATSDDITPSFPDTVSKFLAILNKFLGLDRLPASVNRAAFGAIVLLPVADGEQGYRVISDYLPFDLDATQCSEFSYQINRRRESRTLRKTEVNRLSKWSVGKFTKHNFVMTAEGLAGVSAPAATSFSCRLELDINTVPSPDTCVARDKLAPLTVELVGLASEIIREGDVA
jgi:hypothetical protein